MEKEYFSITVAPYAIADFLRALYRNGDHDLAVTKEDNNLTVRIPVEEYRPLRNAETGYIPVVESK